MAKKKIPRIGIGVCSLCPRHTLTKNICIPGFGPTKPKLVMIAEAPSVVEDVWCQHCWKPAVKGCYEVHKVGVPLVGPSGQLLRRAIRDAGFDPESVFYSNVTRCSGGNPNMIHVRKCVGAYLLDELASLDYSGCFGIVLLGETALKGFFGDGMLKLKEHRLRVLDVGTPRSAGYPGVPESLLKALGGSGSHDPVPIRLTYHPAAALPFRSPELYDEIVGDIMSLKKQRDPLKEVVRIETKEELNKLFDRTKKLAIDLEWKSTGEIRMSGLSNGKFNVIVKNPTIVLSWLEDNTGGA